jgi:hypothetical protein
VGWTLAAPTFSSRWATPPVPGMGSTLVGKRRHASSHWQPMPFATGRSTSGRPPVFTGGAAAGYEKVAVARTVPVVVTSRAPVMVPLVSGSGLPQ